MNFVKTVNNRFVTPKHKIRKKSESASVKRKRAFIDSHNFLIYATPAGTCTMDVIKK